MVTRRVGRSQARHLRVSDADEPKRRVRRRRRQLALEREQSAPDHIRLGRVELVGKSLQSLPLVGDQVHLERCGFSDSSSCHDHLS